MHDIGRFVTQRLMRTLAVVPQGDFLRGMLLVNQTAEQKVALIRPSLGLR
jgi:hypothetical protein